MNDDRWSKQYYLNDKKIQQQNLLKIFQLFWFTEIDKVYFIKDIQYQRNTINRLACYFEPNLFNETLIDEIGHSIMDLFIC